MGVARSPGGAVAGRPGVRGASVCDTSPNHTLPCAPRSSTAPRAQDDEVAVGTEEPPGVAPAVTPPSATLTGTCTNWGAWGPALMRAALMSDAAARLPSFRAQ